MKQRRRQILLDNNAMLSLLCKAQGISPETIGAERDSIGGGGVSQPTGGNG